MINPFDFTENQDDTTTTEPTKQVVSTDFPWLKGLNPEQKQAVLQTDGALLVLSGAGTGKTKVLTTRLAYILATQKAMPWNCLVVTFTNRAAKEMSERALSLAGPQAQNVWLGTFHRICVKILRKYAHLVGLNSNFTILDTDDQERLVKQIINEFGLDTKEWTPSGILEKIERWKDKGLSPERVSSGDAISREGSKTLQIYKTYQERLKALNAVDFGDLILHCLTIFTEHNEVLSEMQNRFHYIMVDEYQDTNLAQYLWLRLLAQKHKNICCVGDDDQSIYSWRGAEVGNILRFETDYKDAKTIRLESNYRSTEHILACASAVIKNNTGRLGKTLRVAKESNAYGINAVKPKVNAFWNGEEEASYIVEEIENIQRKGEKLAETAILVRTVSQTREIEEKLIKSGIPYKVVGGAKFYERLEIRDAMAYIRVLSQPYDDLALERIINKPARGIGNKTVDTIRDYSRRVGKPMFFAAKDLIQTDELSKKAKTSLEEFLNLYSVCSKNMLAQTPGETAQELLEKSGYIDFWKADKSVESAGRIENLRELIGSMDEFATISEFLEHVSLVIEKESDTIEDKVSLMTLHAAKGLEFDNVFLPGWEEGIFPHNRSLNDGGLDSLEEERRLAHVGITRARNILFITFASNRRMFGQWQSNVPSRFVDELPKDHIEMVDKSSYKTGYQQQSSNYQSNNNYYNNSGNYYSNNSHGGQSSNYWSKSAYQAKKKAINSVAAIPIGARVFHQKFGYGTVYNVDGDKLEIDFDKNTRKKVMASFVTVA